MSFQDIILTFTAGLMIVLSVGIPFNLLLYWIISRGTKK